MATGRVRDINLRVARGDQPAAGDVDVGCVCYITDEKVLERSNGTTWDSIDAIGKHAVPVMAASMVPSTTAGCATLATVEIDAGEPDVTTLDFASDGTEYAQFSIPMPKSWNEGTVTFKPLWSHASTTTNFGVVWSLAGVAVGNDDTIGAAFGTAQTSTDTGGTTDDLYAGPESSAITIAGTPAAEDVVFFRIGRIHDDASDTMGIDARLHAIILYITTSAGDDT